MGCMRVHRSCNAFISSSQTDLRMAAFYLTHTFFASEPVTGGWDVQDAGLMANHQLMCWFSVD